MTTLSNLQAMLEAVARALGPELCEQVTFVGGCTTGLLLTDEFTKEGVRHTDDVDLIVHTKGLSGFHELQQTLKDKGFTIPGLSDTTPICAMMLGDLRVDFMPDIEDILTLVDGSDALVEIVEAESAAVKHYIAENLHELLQDGNFENAVFSQSRGDRGREDLIFERLEALASAKPAIGH